MVNDSSNFDMPVSSGMTDSASPATVNSGQGAFCSVNMT